MIPEFGCFALILALCLAGIQVILPIVGLKIHQPAWVSLAKPAAKGQLVFLLIACACLIYALINSDFSVAYVAQNSNTHLPIVYRVAALWGAHEGSLLLWVTLLGGWTYVLTRRGIFVTKQDEVTTFAILGLISIGFLLFMLTTSNPFARWLPDFPREGQDLNPLLQDPGLATHPPMLYMGYVGFAIVFALTLSALINKSIDQAWAQRARPWVLAAWGFLSLGIILGSWWAYRELGWGGWWFWDPVENASFMPWLAGTALLHAIIVTEKRDAAKTWTVLIAICAFSLSLMGTFLVRSGVLISVHAFANDPARGAFMLKFLLAVTGSSLLVYAWRAPTIQSRNSYHICSRETFLLANTVMLMVSMASILLGTLYPLLLDALNLQKISVGAPYFNSIFMPIACGFLVLMGIAPHCFWQQIPPALLLNRLRYTLLAAIAMGCVLPWLLLDKLPVSVALGLTLSLWVILTTGQDFISRCLAAGDFWRGAKQTSCRQFGMLLAHVGVAVCIVGITCSSAYSVEKEVKIIPGEGVELAGYVFRFLGTSTIQGANYQGLAGRFAITQDSQPIAVLDAEKRLYTAPNTFLTQAAIVPGLWRDLYIALGDELGQGAWSVRLYYKPMVRWIWCGGLLMLIGGWLAAKGKEGFKKSKAG